jgi:aminopeptidase
LEQAVTEPSSKMQPLPQGALEIAEKNLRDILALCFEHNAQAAAIVVSDTLSPLAITLTEAYRRCLPQATFIDFYSLAPETVKARLDALAPRDLVVLIQSTSFRMDAFRLRVELFKQSLKVIEHPHLARMSGLEGLYYLESLAYDPFYFRGVGLSLKKLIDEARSGKVESGGAELIFSSPFEVAKLNVGDYTGMQNIGGQFPIGEVFTEAQDLEAVNGRVRIFAFADTSFSVNKPEKPITLIVEKGRIIDTQDSTPEFDQVLANIRADEEEVWLRELGFGLNRAFSPERLVSDIGTYERICGIHLSLGAKHGVYKKPNLRRKDTWHHVDVFAITEAVYLDDTRVYENGAWQV